MQVALYTFGILRYDLDDPQLKGFWEEGFGNFENAAKSKGYLTMHSDIALGAPRFFIPGKDTSYAQTFSTWKSVEDAYKFAYQGSHLHSLHQRREWFVPPRWPTYVLWWVEDGELPAWEEGWLRLEYLYDNGPTPQGFTFKTGFSPQAEPLAGLH